MNWFLLLSLISIKIIFNHYAKKKQHSCGGTSVNMTINTPIAGTYDLRVKSRVAVVHMEKKTNHNMPEMVDT